MPSSANPSSVVGTVSPRKMRPIARPDQAKSREETGPWADKLKVLCARSMTAAVNALADKFARDAGKALDIEADITFGTVGALQARLAAGETADVLILGAPAIAKMEHRARWWREAARTSHAPRSASRSRRRAGAGHFDRRCLQAGADRRARRLPSATPRSAARPACTSPSCGTAWAWPRRSSAQSHAAEDRRRGGCAGGRRQGRSRAHLIAEIVPIKGARVIGKIPAPLGNETTYAAGISASSTQRYRRRPPSSPRSPARPSATFGRPRASSGPVESASFGNP